TQHGTGLARTPWVGRQYGALYPAFGRLKAIFDPRHLFNPGKIVGPDPGLPAWPLRVNPAPAPVPVAEAGKPEDGLHGTHPPSSPHFLLWRSGEVLAEVVNCNGCGHCRTEAPAQRMCPIFRATHAEAATPRAKANLLRHVLHEDPRQLSADAVRRVADLC